ncbi:Gp19/Gp15/Gp42 family protein [Clavibacter capsici]|uniref:Gp19/Gp15/Gp42 family protein n=1 Tax=Clavibacter capsici TaxID=1874630 RepID=UPI00287B7CD3|nr:Gp19/Gp15/Gp42 family protein [Clavibacter capsici]
MGWQAVEVADVQNRWRVLDADEARIAPTLIADAQDILEVAAEAVGVTEAVVAGTERLQRAYVRVVASMVARVLKNPDGFLTETEDAYTYRRDSAVSSGPCMCRLRRSGR